MKITSVRTYNGTQVFKTDVLGDTECLAPPGFNGVIRIGDSWDVDYYRSNDLITKEPLPYLQSKSMEKEDE